MSNDKFHALNRTGGTEETFEIYPPIPISITAKSWLLNYWPAEHAWFVAKPVGSTILGRIIWGMSVYHRSGKYVERFAHIEDLSKIQELESIVRRLRAAHKMKEPPRLENY